MHILSFYWNNLLSYAARLSRITHHASRITAVPRFHASTPYTIRSFALCSLLFALCSLTVQASAVETSSQPETALKKVSIRKQFGSAINMSGKKTEEIILVEVIRDKEGLQKGLSEREGLPDGSGMLFVLDASQEHGFWMKGMRFPLDIIFIGGDMQVTEILENLQPCEVCPKYFPTHQPAYVLEINAGLATKRGIAIGDTLVINK